MYNQIIIKKLEYKGFKNSEETVKVDFTDRTKIYGSNGVGKTTVGEAIAWVFVGSNLSGNTRADSTLINKNAKSMYVKVLFNNGEKDIVLLRYKSSKTTVYVADGNSETWNMPIQMLKKCASEINQKDIEIDSDVFMTVFSQMFFPSIDADRAKRIVSSLVPTVSKDIILESISEYSKNILKNYDLDFPNNLLDKTKKEIKELEKDLSYNEGAKGTITQLIREQNGSLAEGINGMEDRVVDKGNLIKSLDELKEKRLRLKVGLGKPELIDTNQLEKQILELEKKMLEINRKEVEGIEDTTNIKINISVLNSELARLNDLSTDSGDCPTCHRPLNKDELTPIIDSTKSKLSLLQAELNSVEERNLSLITKHKDSVHKAINECENEIMGLKHNIENAKLQNENINNDFIRNQELSLLELDKSIADIEEELKVLQDVEIKFREREIRLKSLEENNSKLDKILAENKMLESKMITLNAFISCIKEYLEKKVVLETESINVYFDRVSLVLSKFVKSSGEIKSCFELSYDGKDYKLLSTGEQIRVFVEISNMVTCLLGIDYPVFLDQAESVSEFKTYSSQIIEAYHVKDSEFIIDNEDKYDLGFQERLAS